MYIRIYATVLSFAFRSQFFWHLETFLLPLFHLFLSYEHHPLIKHHPSFATSNQFCQFVVSIKFSLLVCADHAPLWNKRRTPQLFRFQCRDFRFANALFKHACIFQNNLHIISVFRIPRGSFHRRRKFTPRWSNVSVSQFWHVFYKNFTSKLISVVFTRRFFVDYICALKLTVTMAVSDKHWMN